MCRLATLIAVWLVSLGVAGVWSASPAVAALGAAMSEAATADGAVGVRARALRHDKAPAGDLATVACEESPDGDGEDEVRSSDVEGSAAFTIDAASARLEPGSVRREALTIPASRFAAGAPLPRGPPRHAA